MSQCTAQAMDHRAATMGVKALSDHASCVARCHRLAKDFRQKCRMTGRCNRSLQRFHQHVPGSSNRENRIEDNRRHCRSFGRTGHYDYGASQAPAQPPGARVLLRLPHVFINAVLGSFMSHFRARLRLRWGAKEGKRCLPFHFVSWQVHTAPTSQAGS